MKAKRIFSGTGLVALALVGALLSVAGQAAEGAPVAHV